MARVRVLRRAEGLGGRVPRQLLAARQPRRVRARHGARGRAGVGGRPRGTRAPARSDRPPRLAVVDARRA